MTDAPEENKPPTWQPVRYLHRDRGASHDEVMAYLMAIAAYCPGSDASGKLGGWHCRPDSVFIAVVGDHIEAWWHPNVAMRKSTGLWARWLIDVCHPHRQTHEMKLIDDKWEHVEVPINPMISLPSRELVKAYMTYSDPLHGFDDPSALWRSLRLI